MIDDFKIDWKNIDYYAYVVHKEMDYICPIDYLIPEYWLWEKENFTPCVFFKNGYMDNCRKFIPIVVCDNPYIPITDFTINISKTHLERFLYKIKKKHKAIINYITTEYGYQTEEYNLHKEEKLDQIICNGNNVYKFSKICRNGLRIVVNDEGKYNYSFYDRVAGGREILSNLWFDEAIEFCNKYAIVKINNKIVIIDNNMNVRDKEYGYRAVNLNKWQKINEFYGLPVDIYIDTTEEYKKYGIEPCIYFRNGYNKEKNKFIPLLISKTPEIPYSVNLHIFDKDFLKLTMFVSRFSDKLLQTANKKEYLTEAKLSNKNFEMGDYLLTENPTLDKNKTGLSVNVWLDQDNRYKLGKHYKRFKFIDPNTKKDVTMTIPDLKVIGNTTLSAKELDRIRSFYLTNQYFIDRMMEQDINFDKMECKIIPVDKNGNPINKTIPYEIVRSAGFDYAIIKLNDQYNYINKNKEIVSNIWFDEAYPFMTFNNETFANAKKDNQYYAINLDGTIRKIMMDNMWKQYNGE